MAPVRRIVAELDAAGRELTEREGLAPGEIEILHFADLYHVGQGYFLEVSLDPSADDGLERLYADFLAAHERVHGHAVEAPARFVNVRAVHRQRMPHAAGAPAPARMGAPESPDTTENGRRFRRSRSRQRSSMCHEHRRRTGWQRQSRWRSPGKHEHRRRQGRWHQGRWHEFRQRGFR